MLPNAVKYVVPPTEFLGIYNMGNDNVGTLAKAWSKYKSLKVKDHDEKGSSIKATMWYPIFAAMVNVLLIVFLIGIIFFKAVKWKEYGLPQVLSMIVAL